jgi:hypothetical protein
VYSFFTKEEERKCPVCPFFLIFENILFRVFVVPSIKKKERTVDSIANSSL